MNKEFKKSLKIIFSLLISLIFALFIYYPSVLIILDLSNKLLKCGLNMAAFFPLACSSMILNILISVLFFLIPLVVGVSTFLILKKVLKI